MSFLIAVSSCEKDRVAGEHDFIRRSWGWIADAQRQHLDYIITIGERGTADHHDEVVAPVADTWEALPLKTFFNIRYALDHNHEWLFQCFRDTYISIPRLIRAYAELDADHPVVGNFFFHGVEEGHPCGGAGYWLHKGFMELLLKIPYDEGITKSEDMWLGHVMGQQGIAPFHDSRYDHCSMRGGVSLHNNNITNHLFTHYGHYQQELMGFHEFNPEWLLQEAKQEQTGELSEQNIKRRELAVELARRVGLE